MGSFVKSVEIRWADLDPNMHMRHSAYYDLGAVVRLDYLRHHGVTAESMKEESLGLVIFREECIFKREIFLNDAITIDVKLMKATKDYARWSIKHNFFKNGDLLAAVLNLDGAWIDINKRKLTRPGSSLAEVLHQMPKDDQFEYLLN